jgi:hypothetical protein
VSADAAAVVAIAEAIVAMDAAKVVAVAIKY